MNQVSCCGKKLLPLTLEKLENEWHVISDHPMTKDHSIAFVTLLTGDTVVTRKLYPEWNIETRLPYFRHGILVWYCQHGLFYFTGHKKCGTKNRTAFSFLLPNLIALIINKLMLADTALQHRVRAAAASCGISGSAT